MRNLLLLAASAVALTFSRAATISERTCTPQPHQGYLEVYGSDTYTEFKETGAIGWIAPVPAGMGFYISADPLSRLSSRAVFSFTGCAGGGPFWLFCTNCQSGDSVVGVETLLWDSEGNTDAWLFYNNAGLPPPPPVGDLVFRTSTLFTWDLDSTFIRPMTYWNNYTIQPMMYASQTDSNRIVFSLAAKNTDDVYALWFKAS